MNLKRIEFLKDKIANASMFDVVCDWERELFDLENERVEINEIITDIRAEYVLPETCKECEGKLIFDQINSDMSCEDCGNAFYVGLDPDNPGWSDCHSFSLPYKYQRVSHFTEHLLCVQGIETKTIPIDLLRKVNDELIGVDRALISKADMLKILKKVKKPTYYINVNLIMQITCKTQLPTLPTDIFETLLEMFALIQKPFEMSKPKNRKNFLNYNYTIHKLLEIIGHSTDPDALEYLIYFPLLKKADKNKAHDQIWSGICDVTKYRFFSSFPVTS